MHVTTEKKITYSIPHDELVKRLGIEVQDTSHAAVSANLHYVFVTVTHTEGAEA